MSLTIAKLVYLVDTAVADGTLPPARTQFVFLDPKNYCYLSADACIHPPPESFCVPAPFGILKIAPRLHDSQFPAMDFYDDDTTPIKPFRLRRWVGE